MRITIALEELPSYDSFAPTFNAVMEWYGKTGDAEFADSSEREKARWNQGELEMIGPALVELYSAVKKNGGTFELQGAAIIGPLRRWASVSRTLACTGSVLNKYLLTHQDAEMFNVLVDWDRFHPVLERLAYATRTQIWEADVIAQSERYEILSDNGLWFIYKDGAKGLVGYRSKSTAITDLKQSNFRVGLILEKRYSL